MTGKELAEIRAEWGLTQRELGDILGYHPQKISEMERDKRDIPQVVELYLLAEQRLRAIKKLAETP